MKRLYVLLILIFVGFNINANHICAANTNAIHTYTNQPSADRPSTDQSNTDRPSADQNIKGSWAGNLSIGPAKLPLVLHINGDNNKYTSLLDSPAQNSFGITVDSTSFTDNNLYFSIAKLAVKYYGQFNKDSISGTFTQNGMSFPLKLYRATLDSTNKDLHKLKADDLKRHLKRHLKRPQEPKPPFPYNSENITFYNKKDKIKLSGTLTYPSKGKNFPVVVLVSGSGPQNRDEEILGHKPFLVLSHYLTSNGIACLRYDDRGTAESEGIYKTATLDDFCSDAYSAIEYLRTQRKINNKRIGLIGHSQGGTIGLLLAGEKNNKLSFIVSMAGMSIRGDSLLKLQRYLIAKASNVPDKKFKDNELLVDKLNKIAERYNHRFIHRNAENFAKSLLPDSLKDNEAYIKYYESAILQRISPELNSTINCDPTNALKKINIPVFAIGGEKDVQVPAKINIDRISSLVKAPVTSKIYPNLNHLFQNCETGSTEEYEEIEETISEEVLKDISKWILNTANAIQ